MGTRDRRRDGREVWGVVMFDPHRASCGGYVQAPAGGGPARCPVAVVAAGLYVSEERPASAAWAFACPGHVRELVAARVLLDRDRAEITRRRRAQAGGEPVSATLATGVAARTMAAQARNWARRHPGRLYRSPSG